MSDIIVDYGSLPDDIREKLAELELELSEGKEPESNPQPSKKIPFVGRWSRKIADGSII